MTLTHAPRTTDARTGTPIRVASVPASHPYVQHLQEPVTDASTSVTRLADPPPVGATAGTTRWWPPAMLDPAWIREHADEFDVLHTHFGFDALAPVDLERVVHELRAQGKPFVHTVHDLRNPHHADSALHDAQLDVLVPAADAVITLTPGAAEVIDRRWSREALVLPHPHVVDLETLRGRARSRTAPSASAKEFRVGLHVKSLRACMDPLTILPTLWAAVGRIPGAVLQVDGHNDVLHPEGDRHDERLAEALRGAPDWVDVRVHDYFDDDELITYLASLDLSVLPYRFGTHSGWLEACRDLGTPVAAPTCGFYADQAPVHSYRMDEEGFDPDSLAAAVERAYAETPVPAETPQRRVEQRRALAAAHADLYADLVAGR